MVLDPIPQSLPIHFFGSRPQPPTSPYTHTHISVHLYIHATHTHCPLTHTRVNVCEWYIYMRVYSECIYTHMGWLRLVGSIKLQVSFAEYRLFYRSLLQKRPINLSILLTAATPYHDVVTVRSHTHTHTHSTWSHVQSQDESVRSNVTSTSDCMYSHQQDIGHK